ncbi:MAG TPA: MaoC family dehydratase N-terminal domain-containing protein [Dehalococcoidia bacterium]|nr:MaoC family dehydratase N-terminal domain-containing protein [Dehalococcoidia bacterium]
MTTTDKPEVTFGKITDEALAAMRAKFGIPYYMIRQNEAASKDSIRQFCNGIGDDNPLYRNAEYATRTRWGHIIAPPTFLYAVACPQGMEGLAGVHAFYCGCNWEWFKAIHINDDLTCVDYPTDLIEKQGKMGGRQFLQIGRTVYYNQRGEIVGTQKRETMRVERQQAKERGKYAGMTKYVYTQEELRKVDQSYENEQVRGANPRFWEDVNVGDPVTPVTKGPLGQTDMVEFWVGIGGGQGAHRIRRTYMKRHPKWGIKDPKSGILEPMADVHYESDKSDAIGVPVAYDLGMQRFCWAGHVITNWMGDEGFMKKLSARCILFNVFGDTQFIGGTVAKKWTEGNEYLVEIAIKTVNQRGEETMPGKAVVSLPSKVRWV